MPCGRQHLKLVRLPISPPPHKTDSTSIAKVRMPRGKLPADRSLKSGLHSPDGANEAKSGRPRGAYRAFFLACLAALALAALASLALASFELPVGMGPISGPTRFTCVSIIA
jgi:hypothetical protein